jgi:hypothetical protein
MGVCKCIPMRGVKVRRGEKIIVRNIARRRERTRSIVFVIRISVTCTQCHVCVYAIIICI